MEFDEIKRRVMEPLYEELPIEARALLQLQPKNLSDRVVTTVAQLLGSWEDAGAQLDPIQGDIIINALVKKLVDLHAELRDTNNLVTMMLGQP